MIERKDAIRQMPHLQKNRVKMYWSHNCYFSIRFVLDAQIAVFGAKLLRSLFR